MRKRKLLWHSNFYRFSKLLGSSGKKIIFAIETNLFTFYWQKFSYNACRQHRLSSWQTVKHRVIIMLRNWRSSPSKRNNSKIPVLRDCIHLQTIAPIKKFSFLRIRNLFILKQCRHFYRRKVAGKCWSQNHQAFDKNIFSEIDCGTLDVPPNSDMECTDGSRYQSVCDFICHEGYYMEGVASTRCEADRTYSESVPQCRSTSWLMQQ